MSNSVLLDSTDWSRTPLGPRETWPLRVRAVIETAMESGFPVCVAWGPELVQVYNDGYNAIFGTKHPASFGRPVRETWPEIGPFLEDVLPEVLESGRPLNVKGMLLPLAREGTPEECHFDFSYSPVRDDDGAIVGLMSIAAERTADVVAARRQAVMDFGREGSDLIGLRSIARRLEAALSADRMDARAAAFLLLSRGGAGPARTLWTLGAEAEAFASARARLSGPIDRLEIPRVRLDTAEAPEGCLVPVFTRDGDLRGAIVLVPDPLVPLETSLVPFARDLSGRLHAVLHTVETRRAEMDVVQERLEVQEEMYRSLFDNMRDAAFYLDTTGAADGEGRVIAANASAGALLGYAPAEFAGMPCRELFFPGDEAVSAALMQRRETGLFLSEMSLRHKDGHAVRGELASSQVVLRGGTRAITIVRDLSHRAAIERERAERVRFETMAGLTAGLAHDFNNLLAVIIGSLELLEDRLGPGFEGGFLINNAMHAAERAGGITNQLLAHSQRRPTTPHAVDLEGFIHETRALIQVSLGNRCTLALLRARERLPLCFAESSQLTTALLNLASNARRAMPRGGTLTIAPVTIDPGALPPAPDGHVLPAGRYVGLRVSDTGTGIPEEVREMVFQPFFTTREIGEGCGLGLSMVQGFLRRAGGDIRLAPPGAEGGSEFILVLPAGESPEEAADKDRQRVGTGQRILYVEDNELLRAQTCEMLRRSGFSVQPGRDAREALGLVAAGEPFEILLTDLVLPGELSGVGLAEELWRTRPDLPVVIATGYDPRTSIETDLAGKCAVLRKPYTRRAITDALLTALA